VPPRPIGWGNKPPPPAPPLDIKCRRRCGPPLTLTLASHSKRLAVESLTALRSRLASGASTPRPRSVAVVRLVLAGPAPVTSPPVLHLASLPPFPLLLLLPPFPPLLLRCTILPCEWLVPVSRSAAARRRSNRCLSPLVRSWALGSLPLASSPALGSGGVGESKP